MFYALSSEGKELLVEPRSYWHSLSSLNFTEPNRVTLILQLSRLLLFNQELARLEVLGDVRRQRHNFFD